MQGLLGRAVASVQTCLRNYILRTVTPKLVAELLAVYAENARLKSQILYVPEIQRQTSIACSKRSEAQYLLTLISGKQRHS